MTNRYERVKIDGHIPATERLLLGGSMAKVNDILKTITYPDRQWRQPCLIATFGFPCAGKSAIVSDLSSRNPFVCLSTDAIRLIHDFNSGPETLEAMGIVAEKLFAQNHSVIFDGIHMMRKNRAELRDFGMRKNVQVRFIHVTAHPTVIQQRLKQRAENPEATSQQGKFVITEEHFQRIIQYFESPDNEPDVSTVDTSESTQSATNQLTSLYREFDGWLSD